MRIADGGSAKNVTLNKNSMSNVILTVYAEALPAASSTDKRFSYNVATKYVTSRCDIFLIYEKFELPHYVTAAGSEALQALDKSTIPVLSNIEDQHQLLTPTNVWYISYIEKNLVSV